MSGWWVSLCNHPLALFDYSILIFSVSYTHTLGYLQLSFLPMRISMIEIQYLYPRGVFMCNSMWGVIYGTSLWISTCKMHIQIKFSILLDHAVVWHSVQVHIDAKGIMFFFFFYVMCVCCEYSHRCLVGLDKLNILLNNPLLISWLIIYFKICNSCKYIITKNSDHFCSVILFPIAVTFYITRGFIHFMDIFSPIYNHLGVNVIGK